MQVHAQVHVQLLLNQLIVFYKLFLPILAPNARQPFLWLEQPQVRVLHQELVLLFLPSALLKLLLLILAQLVLKLHISYQVLMPVLPELVLIQ